MDQFVNQGVKNRYMFGGKTIVPLVLRTEGGAGRCIAAQHSQSLESWFVHAPGIFVVTPATPHDAKGLLKTCIRDDNPILFIEHKMLYNEKGEVPDGEYLVPLGEANVTRQGKDLTVVSYSRMANRSLEACKEAAKEGIDAEMIDLRSLKPLDMKAVLKSVQKTGRLLLVSEACENANWINEIAMRVMEHDFDSLDAPVKRVCAADVPIPMSPTLEDAAVPNKERILNAIRELVS